MKDLQIFKSSEFGEFGVLTINDKEMFPATDCARLLGYADPYDAIKRHTKGAVKHRVLTAGGEQQINFITEGDLYRLIVHSKLPSAERFERWVFDEVLPAIREHGGYLTPEKIEEALLNPDTIIRLATDLKEERAARRQLQNQIDQDKPKTIFADSVAASNTTILIGDLAKILRQNGIQIGQNRLFQKLRQEGYLIRKKGTSYNMPTQKAMDLGLFEIKETSINHSDGHITISKTPKVTGKGQIYFVNYFMRQPQRQQMVQ